MYETLNANEKKIEGSRSFIHAGNVQVLRNIPGMCFVRLVSASRQTKNWIRSLSHSLNQEVVRTSSYIWWSQWTIFASSNLRLFNIMNRLLALGKIGKSKWLPNAGKRFWLLGFISVSESFHFVNIAFSTYLVLNSSYH